MVAKATSAAVLYAAATLMGSASIAQTVQGKFGLRLVIEPDCRNPDDAREYAARVAPDASDAVSIARNYLMRVKDYGHLARSALIAEHDLADTGYWLVSAHGIAEPIRKRGGEAALHDGVGIG